MADYILGSGDLYLLVSDTIPETETLETPENKIAHISGGATLTYENEFYEVIDDYNAVLGRILTKEDVTFKSGVLTWDLKVLDKICSGSKFVEGSAGSQPDTLKIGGQINGLKKVVVRFVHTMTDGKKLRATLIGNNSAGFELSFAKDKETIIDAEFKALSQEDGTLVTIEMEK